MAGRRRQVCRMRTACSSGGAPSAYSPMARPDEVPTKFPSGCCRRHADEARVGDRWRLFGKARGHKQADRRTEHCDNERQRLQRSARRSCPVRRVAVAIRFEVSRATNSTVTFEPRRGRRLERVCAGGRHLRCEEAVSLHRRRRGTRHSVLTGCRRVARRLISVDPHRGSTPRQGSGAKFPRGRTISRARRAGQTESTAFQIVGAAWLQFKGHSLPEGQFAPQPRFTG